MAIAPGTTLIDYVLPARRSPAAVLAREGALIIAGSLLMALSARVEFDITPYVPITLQTFVLMLVAASLGSRRGALTMLLYLAEGAVGLPVFAKGGGFAYFLLQPTAGYLVAYPFAAFVIGWLAERGLVRNYRTSILAMLPGSLIVFALGVAWLAFFLISHKLGTVQTAITTGLLPFIPGDLLKEICAAALLPGAWSVVRRVRGEPLVSRDGAKE